MAKLEIPEGCHGHDLQDLMYRFVNWFSLANEKRDNLSYELSQQEIYLELVEAEALLIVDKEIIENNEGRVSADIKKARALIKPVVIDNNTTTLYEQKKILAQKEYELNKMLSKVREIERLISVCQSGLSFDRQEAAMPIK